MQPSKPLSNATSNQQPATSNQQPATSNQQCGASLSRLVIGLALLIGLSSCNKELPWSSTDRSNVGAKRSKIEGFLNKSRSNGLLKSDVTYSQEEALWLFEAALNYGAIDPEARPDEIYTDDFTVKLPISNGVITESDLITAFNAMLDSIAATPLSTNEKLVAMDVVARLNGVDIHFDMTRIRGTGEPLSLGVLNTNFTGSYRNRPNAYSWSISCMERAGDLSIQQRVNQAIGIYNSDWFLTDIESWSVKTLDQGENEILTTPNLDLHRLPAIYFPNPNDPTGPGEGEDDYMTYLSPICYSPGFDCERCLLSDLMSLLTQNMWDLMGQVKVTYASDPDLDNVACMVVGNRWEPLGVGSGSWQYFMDARFYYGNWNNGSQSE